METFQTSMEAVAGRRFSRRMQEVSACSECVRFFFICNNDRVVARSLHLLLWVLFIIDARTCIKLSQCVIPINKKSLVCLFLIYVGCVILNCCLQLVLELVAYPKCCVWIRCRSSQVEVRRRRRNRAVVAVFPIPAVDGNELHQLLGDSCTSHDGGPRSLGADNEAANLRKGKKTRSQLLPALPEDLLRWRRRRWRKRSGTA
jgi:hypothetical protein